MIVYGVIAAALVSAMACGVCAAQSYLVVRDQAYLRSRLLQSMGSTNVLAAQEVELVSEGLAARILHYVALQSTAQAKRDIPAVLKVGIARNHTLIALAGLKGVVSEEGIARARVRLVILFAAGGFLIGALLSDIMACLLAVAGFVGGVICIPRALRHEADERAYVAERELSQMLEVLVLGLQGGLSFDGAFLLYQQYFHAVLSRSCQQAYSQYSHGLVTRRDALIGMAETFDSALLLRVVESIVRAMRFGTSLSATLSALAKESRTVRKTKLEERIAKAPVKMLIPVGTLILPAMLILILGPVVLDLMNGF